jgi:hypothetical protein
VHDSQLEDRVRAALRTEGDALPLTIMTAELERRLTLRRRERAGRRLSLSAAGIAAVLVVSVVGVSNGWFANQERGASAEPSEAALPTSGQSSAPTPQPSDDVLDCDVVEPNEADQPPLVWMGASPGDSIGFFGVLGAYQINSRISGEEGGWTSVRAGELQAVPAGPPVERLGVLTNDSYACLTSLFVEAVPIDQRAATPIEIANIGSAPTRVIEFARPPLGEWLLRVRTEFATIDGAPLWTEMFFRVDARNPDASLGPVLGSLPLIASPPATIFIDQHSEALEPSTPTGETSETLLGQVPPRGQYIVQAVCAGGPPMRWSIGHEGQFGFLAAGDVTCDGRFIELAVDQGLPSAPAEFVIQGDPGTAWRFRIFSIADEPSFIPPPLRLWVTGDPDGLDDAAEAYPRCISTAEASDPCSGEWMLIDGAKALLAASGASVTLALPEDGWTVDGARVTAVARNQILAGQHAPEYSVGFAEVGEPEITIPVELGRGSWIIRVALNATRGGETFGAYYDFLLTIRDQE